MEFWPEFLASSWGKEFFAGGLGGMAGVISGYPLDTLRIRLQQPPSRPGGCPPSAAGLLRNIVKSEGPAALYRGMAAPLASVTFQVRWHMCLYQCQFKGRTTVWQQCREASGTAWFFVQQSRVDVHEGPSFTEEGYFLCLSNAVVFQVYAVLSRAFDSNSSGEPPSYKSVALAGVGTGTLQSLMLSPVELVKIRLQVQVTGNQHNESVCEGPICTSKNIWRKEGLRGLYRGLSITVLRDAPALGVYFWTYEYAREKLHPGCRKSGEESLGTMLFSGGLAGVTSWMCCYPLDVVKSRLQAQSASQGEEPPPKYRGIADCFRKSVREEGYGVLWRGLGTAVARAFIVNGAIFSAYELALRFMGNNNNNHTSEES